MNITNNYNLPEQIVKAVTFGTRKPDNNVISVTELIGPTLIRSLRLKHWEELSEDASERLWALLGTSVHYITEKHQLPDSFAEERLKTELGGVTITGQADNYNTETKTVEDWKVTSVWSFIHGVRTEWVAQLNLYAWLWNQNGFEVNNLKIYAILRDWQKGRSAAADYPDIPFHSINIPIWSLPTVFEYITNRIQSHFHDVQPCTNNERWAKDDVYAVMKEGRKSAVKLFDDFKEAVAFSEADKKYTVIKRPGEFVRCRSYCPVRAFCTYNPYNEGENK